MREIAEDEYVSADTAIKSIPISELENCIASAIAKITNASKLNCHLTEVESSDILSEVKLKLSLSNELGDVGF